MIPLGVATGRTRQPENQAVMASSQSRMWAGGHEQRSLFAENFGGTLLQAIDGRVLAVNVVAHFGFRHGATHRCGRFGDSIAAQIDHERLVVSRLADELGEDFVREHHAARRQAQASADAFE
jgi:hypothetical protein